MSKCCIDTCEAHGYDLYLQASLQLSQKISGGWTASLKKFTMLLGDGIPRQPLGIACVRRPRC